MRPGAKIGGAMKIGRAVAMIRSVFGRCVNGDRPFDLRIGLLLVSLGVAACGVPPAPATTTAPGATTPVMTPSLTADAVPITVRFGGRIGCAMFPYSCTATLSVLGPNADIPEAWRPAPTDPWWGAEDSTGSTAGTFDPKPLAGSPAAAPGRHLLVVSLLGSYDTPSYAPDGSRAFDLLGRCVTDVEVEASAGGLRVVVTFTPDDASFRASCTVIVQ